ncbi:MAG: GNAT family N-acetyltransferase [Thermomicrobiales bacterium]
MTWILRPWIMDAAAVDELLSIVWGEDDERRAPFSVHGPPNDDPERYCRSLVAVADGAVVGVGTVWEYWLHPARWRLALHVHPNFRCRGIGSALFERLVAAPSLSDPRPLQVATYADDHDGRGFLDARGFRPLMRTRLGTINRRTIRNDIEQEHDVADRTSSVGYRLATLEDLLPALEIEGSVAALHAEAYRRGHSWNPPSPRLETNAGDLFFGDDLIQSAMFVAMGGSSPASPAAVGSLRSGVSPGEVDLGWVCVANQHWADAANLTAALVGRCITEADRHGWVVRIEVDEADEDLWRILHRLPVSWEPDWLTFTLDPHRG